MISVIVPVYNVEAYFSRCIDSIIKQTYTDLEIILVDDGSLDNSGQMCEDFKKKDNRIKVIHKKNGGLSDARNAGLEIATGNYIGFVDSDDWIEIDMYDDLVKAIVSEKAEMAVTGINRVYDNGYNHYQFVSKKPFSIVGDSIIQAYLRQGTFSSSVGDKLFISSLFNKRRFPVGKQYEDAPVIFDILCSINTVAVVGKPQYNYFQRADSICGQAFSIRKMDHYYFSKEIWKKVYNDYPQYIDDADTFWGCKLVEILYSLDESSNKGLFKRQEQQMKDDLSKVKKSVLMNTDVPSIMKLKTVLLLLNCAAFYTWIKRIGARRGS